MLSRTYDALKAAGVPDNKAREAVEEIAGYENRPVGIEPLLTGIEAKVSMLQWMLGLNLAVSLAIVVILFRSLAG